MSRIDELIAMSEDELSDLIYAYKESEAEQMYCGEADGDIFEIKEDESAEINNGGQTAQVEWLLNYENYCD